MGVNKLYFNTLVISLPIYSILVFRIKYMIIEQLREHEHHQVEQIVLYSTTEAIPKVLPALNSLLLP